LKKTILIVDDEPNIVMTLEYGFKKRGYQVFIARDGGEALELLETEVPSVVLLDVMMPNVDGFQTLGAIRNTPNLSHIKVVFLTAKSKPEDVRKGLAAGADRYLTKPFSVKKIIEEIEQLLQAS
jgi:DNA-binding response OmpR family regulator